MFRRKLVCSFCRRDASHVEKLVAGPRVYICDRCAAEVVRIMKEADQSGHSGVPAGSVRPAAVGRVLARVRRLWRGVAGRGGPEKRVQLGFQSGRSAAW